MNINTIIILLFVSVISLLGTLIGSSVGLLIKNPSKRLLGALIGLAAGIMLSVVVFDLIPECIKKWNFASTIATSLIGIAIIAFTDKLTSKKGVDSNKHLQIALLTAIGLMLHNFPEGIIMGCGFIVGGSLGIKMCILIAVHDIPEGIAVAAPMVASKIDPLKIFIYTALTALPTAFGATMGIFIGGVSESVLGTSLGLASGIMLYVVCGKMIPEANTIYSGITTTLGILMGFLLGLAMCTVL
ncbi:ZIP family metal transporter [Clostridium arbusti]|uniref:ZIP family metal transporter n=1 Tax=Clostridium arbusti TaxID=1137848 RepID=UPI00028899F1